MALICGIIVILLAVSHARKLENDWHEVKRKKPSTPKTGFENTDQEELDFQFDEELENQGIKSSSSKYW